jgi:hypothetical protein
MNPHNVMIRASELLIERGLKPELSPQARAVIEAICELTNKTNGNVATIQNQKALERVEARMGVIRGQSPLAKTSPLYLELMDLKKEQKRLTEALNYKI